MKDTVFIYLVIFAGAAIVGVINQIVGYQRGWEACIRVACGTT